MKIYINKKRKWKKMYKRIKVKISENFNVLI
jgi:hypothetical protein